MIRMVTALPAEARPIVRHFGLERDGRSARKIYRRGDLELIVSGVGSAATAAAVREAADGGGRRPRGWINVGIAGHRDAPLGSLRLAHKIVDGRSGRAWYPSAVFEPPCPGAAVVTVDAVERRLEGDALYDMEAAGFYEAALRFATAELVQVLKVVSDNRGAPPERLTAAAVEALIEGSLSALEMLVGELSAIAAELERRTAPPAGLDDFLERWHFTVTEARQLERLLERLATLGRPAAPESFVRAKSAAVVLDGLRGRI